MDRSSPDLPSQTQIKSERASDSPLHRDSSPVPYTNARFSSNLSSANSPLPSTERADSPAAPRPSSTGGGAFKKKGIANVKKPSKRSKKALERNGVGVKKVKRDDVEMKDGDGSDAGDESGAEESDHGPYCLCRGPDDHRWMICCESCDDWFHGECINLDKSIGESLMEKFVCPNCTTSTFRSIYKKTCSLGNCKRPARLALSVAEGLRKESVFCSDEHRETWWERMVGKLPTMRRKDGGDVMAQEEFMALVEAGLGEFDDDGVWRLASDPFKSVTGTPKDLTLSAEEELMIQQIKSEHTQLETEKDLSRKMLHLIELATDRRRTAIQLGHFTDDICGYDDRLDTVSSRDAFAAYASTPEALILFASIDDRPGTSSSATDSVKLGDPFAEDDVKDEEGEVSATRGMCGRKRCPTHRGWAKMLTLGVRCQIKEIEERIEEVEGLEGMVKEAAAERARRKGAEKNWVEVL